MTLVHALQPETAPEELEATTHQMGQASLRRAFQAQWEMIDRALVSAYTTEHGDAEITCDGQGPITVASRFGRG